MPSLKVPSHYLNQCWFRIIGIHPHEISYKNHKLYRQRLHLNLLLKYIYASAMGQWVNLRTLCLQQEVRHVTTTMSHILDMLWQPYTSRPWLSCIWLSTEMSSFWRNSGRWSVTVLSQQLRHFRFIICHCDRYVICFCWTPMGQEVEVSQDSTVISIINIWEDKFWKSFLSVVCPVPERIAPKSARPIMTMFRPKWCNAQIHKDIFRFREINSPRK